MSTKMLVKLAEVVRDNFNDVIELEIKEEQKKYIESNVYTIAESTVSKYFHLTHHRAVCVDEKVVGFVQYQFGEIGELDEHECTIWRFMIDRRHQNSGIGKIAMGLLLKEIKAHDRCNLVDVYYDPKNKPAKKLYARLGFKENGVREDGNVIAEIML